MVAQLDQVELFDGYDAQGSRLVSIEEAYLAKVLTLYKRADPRVGEFALGVHHLTVSENTCVRQCCRALRFLTEVRVFRLDIANIFELIAVIL